MTREQQRLRRRRVLCWIAATAVIVGWLAALLAICANAAETAEAVVVEAAQGIDPLTKVLVCIGATCVSCAFVWAIERLDQGRTKK